MKVHHQPSSPGTRWAHTHQQSALSCRYFTPLRVHSLPFRLHASSRVRAASSSELRAAASTEQQADVERLRSSQEASASGNGSNGAQKSSVGASSGTRSPELCSPEELVLEPGEVSMIGRSSPLDPADVYRCPGCLEEACQVPLWTSAWCL